MQTMQGNPHGDPRRLWYFWVDGPAAPAVVERWWPGVTVKLERPPVTAEEALAALRDGA